MVQTEKNEVLLLARDRLYLYNGGEILSLEFPANIVHDVDIQDSNALYELVTMFIQNNKLTPAQLFFVLSESVCFSKDFAEGDAKTSAGIEEGTKAFTDTIPFSSVVFKAYKTANTLRVVGSNQDLIDTILNAFEDKGFGLSALVPANIFSELGTTSVLTPVMAQAILGKRDAVITASMVGARTEDQQLATSQTAVPKNKILPYLIGIFVVLILILIAFIVLKK